MPGPVDDQALQDDLIDIGRHALLAAHASLLKKRNDPNWEISQNATHSTVEAGRLIGLDLSDSTEDDYLAEGASIEAMVQEGSKRGVRVLRRDEMVQPELKDHVAGQHVIGVIGEEYMKPQNNPRWKGLEGLVPGCDIIALVDPLDGTVLRQRDLPNWCIAIAFYTRNEGEVLASLVVQAVGDLFYATKCRGAFRQTLDFMNPIQEGRLRLGEPKPAKMEPPTPEKHLAFVAQKPGAFIEMAKLGGLLGQFDRVYNLGGNPMLAKLADASMTAVFEPKGHKAHDVVPGAFIARMANAAVLGLDGKDLDWGDALRHPDHKDGKGKLAYVAATRKDLAQAMLAALPKKETLLPE
jgi:fructose-1,6-bisphosphatase/inositol monophosphatase family enzyme